MHQVTSLLKLTHPPLLKLTSPPKITQPLIPLQIARPQQVLPLNPLPIIERTRSSFICSVEQATMSILRLNAQKHINLFINYKYM